MTNLSKKRQLHPFARRLLAEDFSRLRRSNEKRRYAASQRRGRVDPNPHQIDAVAFALERIPEGGCILADEVGLGKTIEAGLIIAQLLAEGIRRVLLITPKSLIGQWQNELFSLFGIDVQIGRLDPEAFAGEGVFIVNREFAGGIKGAPLLSSSEPFDLIVIDEAHEVFAGIYKRFDRDDEYNEDSKKSQTAHRVREIIQQNRTPVLLLTATPLQNRLEELWGLVHFVEPNQYLLGSLSTFRKVFAIQDEEQGLSNEQAFDLRQRLKQVIQRSLRRQAQEFLKTPFVERQAKTIEYSLSEEERKLYDDVTIWLMSPKLVAFKSNARRILTVGFHRRMASSFAALSASLENVVLRLKEELAGKESAWDATIREFANDLEEDLEDFAESDDDQEEGEAEPTVEQNRSAEKIKEEIELIESFVSRASKLQQDTKANYLLTTLGVIRQFQRNGEGTGKTVIFTESLKTQEFLFELLTANGFSPQDVTLFRGTNDNSRAKEAMKKWENEIGSKLPEAQKPTASVAMRLALIHEFKTSSKVFISTEAGAKGLNLQFCETLINYDLPWNPQRIEQRIGRIHRYGQKRGVTVFNFLDRENEAAVLTYEILTKKLDLFGKVLDVSDVVLHTPDETFPGALVSGIGTDFERQVSRIFSQSTSLEDVTAQLRSLRQQYEENRKVFDDHQERATRLIQDRLDDTVSQIFREYEREVPACLQELDRELDLLLEGFLDVNQIGFCRTESAGLIEYSIEPSQNLPDGFQDGLSAVIGGSPNMEDGVLMYPGHPIIQMAVDQARLETDAPIRLRLKFSDQLQQLAPHSGKKGRLRVTKLKYRGLAPVDRLMVTILLEDEFDPVETMDVCDLINHVEVESWSPENKINLDQSLFEEIMEEELLDNQAEVKKREETIFESKLDQLDRYLGDRALVLRQKRRNGMTRLREEQRKRSSTSSPTAVQALDKTIKTINSELNRLDREIQQIQDGQDPNYQEWRQRLFDRRFAKPDVEIVVEADVILEGGQL